MQIVATTTPSWLCSCVLGLQHQGINIKGHARDLVTNSAPFIGAVAKFYYKNTNTYHAALITKFTDKGFIIYETNFKKCQETKREVLWSDPALIGFIDNTF